MLSLCAVPKSDSLFSQRFTATGKQSTEAHPTGHEDWVIGKLLSTQCWWKDVPGGTAGQ